MAKPQRSSRASGHSLVELLIVVAILLVVMAIALPKLMAARQSAQETSAVAFLRNLHAAQEQFYIVNGKYAATFAELNGYLAKADINTNPLRPREILTVRFSTLPMESMPTLAFLLMPMQDGGAYSSGGVGRPTGTETQSSGGSTPLADSNRGGGSNPGGESNGGGDGSGSGENPGDQPEGNPEGQGGSPGAGSGPGGARSAGGVQGDRMTHQGYEFYLIRPNAHAWKCLATPVSNEHDGNHYFADQSGTIRQEFGRSAGTGSPIL